MKKLKFITAAILAIFTITGCSGKKTDNSISIMFQGSDAEQAAIKASTERFTNKTGINFMTVGTVVASNRNHNFVLDGNNIELNFDTDEIEVESYETATYFDEYYQCQVPYIYDNGLLLEALAWYCLFKYLSRGSKHQVYSLSSPNQVLNPYMQWSILKPKAMASVKIAISRSSDGWNNFFYNSTFLPRN